MLRFTVSLERNPLAALKGELCLNSFQLVFQKVRISYTIVLEFFFDLTFSLYNSLQNITISPHTLLFFT